MSFAIHPLNRMIAEGEGTTQDFKKTITSPAKIAKSLVAFANTRGGRLLVGVRDNGRISGTDPEEEGYMVESAANFFCNPPIRYELVAHEYQGLRVLEVIIPESKQKPHLAKGEDDRWWAYVRVNDNSVLASVVAVEVLRRQTAQIPTVIQYNAEVTRLVSHLRQHKRITLSELCALLSISRRAAVRLMVDLVSASVVRIHHTESPEYYTLVPNE